MTEQTRFSEIYPFFLSAVDDGDFSYLDEDELVVLLNGYLIRGLLAIQEIPSLLEFDAEQGTFNRKLHMQEKLLVSKAMTLAWVTEKRNSADLMRKSIGDRDYKAVQGTDYLRRLNDTETKLRRELREDLMRFLYEQIESWGS